MNTAASERFKLEQRHCVFLPPGTGEALLSEPVGAQARARGEAAQDLASLLRREARPRLTRRSVWEAIFPYVVGALLVLGPALGLYLLWRSEVYTRRAQIVLSFLGFAGFVMQLAILHTF